MLRWSVDDDDDDLHQLVYVEAHAATWFSLFIQNPLSIPSIARLKQSLCGAEAEH